MFQLNYFYFNQEWLKARGYVRTVAYRFRQGYADPSQDGMNFVFVTVEHYFRRDTNVTYEGLKEWHETILSQTQGKLRPDVFEVAPSSVVACEIELVYFD